MGVTPMITRTKRLAVAAALTGCALLVCAAAGATTKPKPKPKMLAMPGNATLGRHLFVAQQCGSCHMMAAANAMDGTGMGPDLDHVTKTYAQIVTQITSGGHGMTAYKGVLSAAQIEDVALFIYQTSHPK